MSDVSGIEIAGTAAESQPIGETLPANAAPVPPTGADPGRLAGVTAILVRELRGRMRGKRAFIFLTVYLAILVGLFWMATRASEGFVLMGALESIGFGRGVFGAVMLLETLVVVALAPAYTAGLISAEREKQTFDLLAVTPISSLSIVVGKLLSGLSYLAIIVGASIPLACMAFIFGGVGPEDIVRGYLVVAVTGIGLGSIGVWCSAAMKRTQAATVSAFVVTALMVAGATAAWATLESRGRPPHPPEALLYLNPFAAQLDVICQASGSACIVTQALSRPAEPDSVEVVPAEFAPVGPFDAAVPVPAPFFQPPPPPPPGGDFWPKSVLVYLLLTPLALAGAAQSVSPTRRWQWPGRSQPPQPPEVPVHD
ncbi:MAG TPA: ABC transporter permease [Candidatus Limnocylindrales bacterium]|nr:ABC transporter permease [Candidatus Limnocylindrales bacterium]